ncbi:hypothetical protein V6N13_059235 [Hibiscus sabdariffa]
MGALEDIIARGNRLVEECRRAFSGYAESRCAHPSDNDVREVLEEEMSQSALTSDSLVSEFGGSYVKSPGARSFDLAGFPWLGDSKVVGGKAGATVVGGSVVNPALVWVKLWHVPLELFSQQGPGYVASVIGKPLYTDRAATLKQQLEFAKICVESHLRCGHCSIFGHSEDNCSKKKVVKDSDANVDGGEENNCDAKVDGDRVNNYDPKVDFTCDVGGSLGVDSHDSGVVELTSPIGKTPRENSGESLESPNKFELLCSVAEGQDGRVDSP